MLYKDEAIVLRSMRLGEADKIVTALGKSTGKITAVAKGIRKTKSRFGGRLEPFSRVSLVLWAGRSNLDTVTQVEVVDTFRVIREDLAKFSIGEVMLEAADKVAQERESAGGLFALLVDSLEELVTNSNDLQLASFLLKVLSLAGFRPELSVCAECGSQAVWFSAGQGGSVCDDCRSVDAREAAEVLELLNELQKSPRTLVNAPPELVTRAVRMAKEFAEYHFERKLKAASAAEAMLG